MPELPEVEVTRRLLEPILLGREIVRVTTTRPSYFFLTPPTVLKQRLMGLQVLALKRIGKYLLAELSDGSKLLLHLGMTGQLFASGSMSPRLSLKGRGTLLPADQKRFAKDVHTHLELEFADGDPRLYFRDVRKFGKCAWLAPGIADPRLTRLGVDALEVTGAQLYVASRRRKAPLKSWLLDQSVLAGVGNIYADEALFEAKLSPRRASGRLSRREADTLAHAIGRVLREAIAAGGSSIDDFIKPDGSDGGYQDQRRAYGRAGLPCPRCGAAIRRRLIAQRSTHWCSHCQR